MTETLSILIATTDAALAGALGEQCAQFGLSCHHSATPGALREALSGTQGKGDFDAIVLEEGFGAPSDTDYDDLLADCMAATNYSSGVLLLCAPRKQPDKPPEQRIPGIRTLTQPLRLGRFLMALAGVLESGNEADHGGPRRIGPYMLYPAEKTLRRREGDTAGQDIRLTDKEVSILAYLHERAGQSVAREDLLQDVWQYSGAVMTRTLETHIYRLRQKIEDDPSSAKLLRTESGGYSLCPDDAP